MNETSLSGGFHPQNPPEIVRGVIEQLAREAAEYDDIQPVGRWLDHWMIGSRSGDSYGHLEDCEDTFLLGVLLNHMRYLKAEPKERRDERLAEFEWDDRARMMLANKEARARRKPPQLPEGWSVRKGGKP